MSGRAREGRLTGRDIATAAYYFNTPLICVPSTSTLPTSPSPSISPITLAVSNQRLVEYQDSWQRVRVGAHFYSVINRHWCSLRVCIDAECTPGPWLGAHFNRYGYLFRAEKENERETREGGATLLNRFHPRGHTLNMASVWNSSLRSAAQWSSPRARESPNCLPASRKSHLVRFVSKMAAGHQDDNSGKSSRRQLSSRQF